jgi:GNAT superfamily N-acetyltransferase
VSIELSDDPARLDLDRVHGWLTTSYWSPGVSREKVEAAVRGSEVVGAYDATGQVGYARLVTDRATHAWLCDVVVDESARGRGVGKALVERCLARCREWGLRRVMLATADAHGLYARYGFAPLEDGRFLQLWLSPPPAPHAGAAAPS